MEILAALVISLLAAALVILGHAIGREETTGERKPNKPRPLYFVQHPDGSFSKADPQP